MAGGIELKVDIGPQLKAFANRLEQANKTMPAKLAKMVHEVGPIATSQMKRVLPKQTGLKFKTINRALKGKSQGMRYVIASKGGDVRLKFFNARETARGVTAAPWNSRRLYPATFIKSGWWPKRGKPIGGGHVFQRTSAKKLPIQQVRSGLFIPNEMVTGNSAVVFYGTVDHHIGPALERVLFDAL